MPYLDRFTDEQRTLLISLPYRVGLWVSKSDESGGAGSAAAEMQALESIITGFAEDFLKSEFVEELMRGTLANRAQWSSWERGLEDVPSECAKAVDVLNGQMEGKDVLSFRQNLMEIAVSVARSYTESDGGDTGSQGFSASLRHGWACFLAALKKLPPPLREGGSISKAERQVLARLSAALQVDFEGNPINNAAAA